MRKQLSRLALMSAVVCFGVLLLPGCGGTGDIEDGWNKTFSQDGSDTDKAPASDGDLVAVADTGASAEGGGTAGEGQEKDELDLGDLESLEEIDAAAEKSKPAEEVASEDAPVQEKDELDLDDLDDPDAKPVQEEPAEPEVAEPAEEKPAEPEDLLAVSG